MKLQGKHPNQAITELKENIKALASSPILKPLYFESFIQLSIINETEVLQDDIIPSLIAKSETSKLAFNTVEVQQQTKDSLSIGLELLSDIGEKLKSWDKSEIPSKILLLKLLNDEELDWSRYDFGRPISFKWLANKLKPYRVFPYKRRNHKAYSVSEINDAIKRYLPHID